MPILTNKKTGTSFIFCSVNKSSSRNTITWLTIFYLHTNLNRSLSKKITDKNGSIEKKVKDGSQCLQWRLPFYMLLSSVCEYDNSVWYCLGAVSRLKQFILLPLYTLSLYTLLLCSTKAAILHIKTAANAYHLGLFKAIVTRSFLVFYAFNNNFFSFFISPTKPVLMSF